MVNGTDRRCRVPVLACNDTETTSSGRETLSPYALTRENGWCVANAVGKYGHVGLKHSADETSSPQNPLDMQWNDGTGSEPPPC